MSFRYKINVLVALKDAGYNTKKIRVNKIMGEATLQKIRRGEMVSWHNLDIICTLLGCQVSDIIEHIEDPES